MYDLLIKSWIASCYTKRKGKHMEQFFYENRPTIYGLISFYALFISRNSALMVVSGLVLLGCAIRIQLLRREYKKGALISDLHYRLRDK